MATAEKTVAAADPALDAGIGADRAWLGVVVAALAMVATLPGRTHGLGLVTEPLLADLHLDRVTFADINLWATLLGAAFCIPCGWLIDRAGARVVLAGVTFGLAATVIAMSQAATSWGSWLLPGMFGLVLLTRGLGQSALSVVSLALMGRSVGRRAAFGVGVYSCVVALGFMSAFAAIKYIFEGWEPSWRVMWCGIGVAVALFGWAAFPLISPGRREEKDTTASVADPNAAGLTLGQTLRTPAFWVFAGATSLYGLVTAGLSLFNQSILAERNFDRSVFLTITTLMPMVGLAANLATGWLAGRISHGRLLAGGMFLLAAALVCFPLVQSLWQVYLYAVALGIAGGMVTVIFFGVWVRAFGIAHLGKIQGAAQLLTVVASAVGPLLLASTQAKLGSYVPMFHCLAGAAALFAVAAWIVPLPRIGQATSHIRTAPGE
jgi:MFS family permease